jgi:hypothetical protein
MSIVSSEEGTSEGALARTRSVRQGGEASKTRGAAPDPAQIQKTVSGERPNEHADHA